MLTLNVVENYRKYYDDLILGKRVLDIGCGKGLFLEKIHSAIGIDIDKKSLKYAKKTCKQEVVLADSTNLPFKDNAFDIIHLEFVVEHLTDVKQSFKEMKRCLKLKSYFIIITTNLWNPLVLFKSILPKSIAKIHNPFYVSYYRANTLSKLDRIMTRLGYKRIKICRWSNRESITKNDTLLRKIIVFIYNSSRLIFRWQMSATFLAIYANNF